MEFKGTKGRWVMRHSETKSSWKVLGTTLGARYNIVRCDYIYDPNLDINWNKFQSKEQKANALLISKAPEMLDFINRISGEMLRSDFVLSEKWYDQAQELIKQATKL